MRVVLAAILVGALVASGVALGSSRLDTAYQWIAGADNPDVEVDVDADPDGDGLSTAVERAGVTTEAGDTFVTDPKVADTDGDGLADGEEAGALITTSDTSPVYSGISDPARRTPTTTALQMATSTSSARTCTRTTQTSDGLPDEEELDFGSDPLAENPDDDAYSDEEERERGSAPMAYDESGWRAHVSTALAVLQVRGVRSRQDVRRGQTQGRRRGDQGGQGCWCGGSSDLERVAELGLVRCQRRRTTRRGVRR